jgi:peptidoglycan hydrolase-like protein with peptidoglycan-binding domain
MNGKTKDSSALGDVLADSLPKAQLTPQQLEQQAFSQRTAALRKRMQALYGTPRAKEVVPATEFDAVFKDVQTIWHREPHDYSGADEAFTAVETALDTAEERVATHLRELEEKRLALEVFDQTRKALAQRVDNLVKTGFAALSDFAVATGVVDGLFNTQVVTGVLAEQAVQGLEALIVKAEVAAEQAKLFAQALKTAQERLALLAKNRYLSPTTLDRATASFGEADTAAKTPDYDEAARKLKLMGEQLDKVDAFIVEEMEMESNRGSYVETLCSSSLQSLKVDEEDLVADLSTEQLTQLVRLEKRRLAASKTQKPKIAEAIRVQYKAFIKQNEEEAAEDEEEEDEVEVPVETATEKRERIHQAKLRRKSITTLLTLDAEGEIFRVNKVFANKGADFRVGNTGGKGDFVPDWVAGYDVLMRNAPAGPPLDGRYYDRMIVHFHFSDKNYSKIQRAHFKNNHGASDKGHVIISSQYEAQALAICEKYL